MVKVYIKTYGCQMNERDSEAVAAQLLERGFTIVEREEDAEVILLNTCSVRGRAEEKALGQMRYLAGRLARKRPDLILGFLGCMAQARGEELIRTIPEVRLVLGTQRLHLLADYLQKIIDGKENRIVDIEATSSPERDRMGHLYGAGMTRVRAYVTIMHGCNMKCSFCIVPYTRGPERSRPISEIVAECRELASHGVKEVILLGQIVTNYGRGMIPFLKGKSPFVQLLEAVHEIDGIERIRFTSPHPSGYRDDLIEAYQRLPKLCESVHLPLQSGSNRILRKMRRGYTREKFLEVVHKLRCINPDMGISTDIIVGYPGETEDDFQQTIDLVRLAAFDSAYVFKFSPRPGTPAAEDHDQLPQDVIEQRHQRLLQVVNEVAFGRFQRMVGRTVEVLVYGPSRKNPRKLEGRTRCHKIAVFDGPDSLIGKTVRLYVESSTAVTLYGRIEYNQHSPLVSSNAQATEIER